MQSLDHLLHVTYSRFLDQRRTQNLNFFPLFPPTSIVVLTEKGPWVCGVFLFVWDWKWSTFQKTMTNEKRGDFCTENTLMFYDIFNKIFERLPFFGPPCNIHYVLISGSSHCSNIYTVYCETAIMSSSSSSYC